MLLNRSQVMNYSAIVEVLDRIVARTPSLNIVTSTFGSKGSFGPRAPGLSKSEAQRVVGVRRAVVSPAAISAAEGTEPRGRRYGIRRY